MRSALKNCNVFPHRDIGFNPKCKKLTLPLSHIPPLIIPYIRFMERSMQGRRQFLSDKSAQWLLLGLGALLLLLHHLLGWLGPFGYDDLQYALHAKALLAGQWDWTDQFAHRFAVLIPMAVSIALFGPGDLAMSLPALLASLALIWLVLDILRSQGWFAMAMGLLLVFGAKWMLFYSDKAMPDLWVALGLLGAFHQLHRQRFAKAGKANASALVFALWLTLAFLAKGTVLLFIPILLGVFISDVFQKRQLRFWRWFGLWFGILALVYLLTMQWIAGNALIRFEALASNSYLNACSYDQQPIKFLYRRVTIGWLEMAWSSVLLTAALALLPMLAGHWPSKWLRAKDPLGFWGYSAALSLASANFMSISYKAYVPLCLDPRHYLWLLPLLGIPAAMWFNRSIGEKKQLGWALLFTCFLLWWGGPDSDLAWPYIWPLFIALMARIFFQALPVKLVYLTVVSAFLWNQYSTDWHYARKINFRAQQQWAKEALVHTPPGSVLVSNEVQARLFTYYGYPPHSNWYSYAEWDSLDRPSPRGILFLNPYTRGLSGSYEKALPWFARFPAQSGRLMAENPYLSLSLWALESWPLPEKDGALLFESLQDFETEQASWSHKPLQIRNEKAHSGQYAAWFTEFSSGYSLRLDSQTLGNRHLVVEARMWLLSEDSTKAQLVFSLDKGAEAIAYESLALQPFLKTFGHWWPIRYQWPVPKEAISGTTLKAYVYNPDSLGVWLDDLQIKGWMLP